MAPVTWHFLILEPSFHRNWALGQASSVSDQLGGPFNGPPSVLACVLLVKPEGYQAVAERLPSQRAVCGERRREGRESLSHVGGTLYP